MENERITKNLRTPTIPGTPNYIKLKNGVFVPIWKLSDEELKRIGKQWTNDLVERAKRKRKIFEKILT